MIKYRQFAVRTMILAVPLFVIIAILSLFEYFQSDILFVWFCFLFFVSSTLVSGYYNLRSLNKPIFGTIYFGTSSLKILVYLGALFSYKYFLHPEKWVIIPYVLLFLIFKGFELIVLFKQVDK